MDLSPALTRGEVCRSLETQRHIPFVCAHVGVSCADSSPPRDAAAHDVIEQSMKAHQPDPMESQ
jgi:hypothetical protein